MGKKILIVEDDPDMLNLYRGVLKELYDVIMAVNGKEAVDMANSQLPVLILMDIMMPVMDGWEALARLKANPATTTIPVILLSALSGYQDIRRGYSLGADNYITKPFTAKELLKGIKQCLGEQAA